MGFSRQAEKTWNMKIQAQEFAGLPRFRGWDYPHGVNLIDGVLLTPTGQTIAFLVSRKVMDDQIANCHVNSYRRKGYVATYPARRVQYLRHHTPVRPKP
jgi:hypothetical protein